MRLRFLRAGRAACALAGAMLLGGCASGPTWCWVPRQMAAQPGVRCNGYGQCIEPCGSGARFHPQGDPYH